MMFCCALFVLSLRRIWSDGEQGRRNNVVNIQCCQYQFSMSKLGSIACYLPGDKIIMLLPGKYGIICASKQRSMHDAC